MNILIFGDNDTYLQGDSPHSSVEDYAKNMQQLIQKAVQLVGKERVLCIGLTPVDQTRTTPVAWCDISYLNERIQQFDEAQRAICTEQGIAFVPVMGKFQAEPGWQKLLLDGLHPSAAGHELLYNLIAPEIQKLA